MLINDVLQDDTETNINSFFNNVQEMSSKRRSYRRVTRNFLGQRNCTQNLGTLINNHVQHGKEILSRRGKSPVFFLETLKNCILNENFNP